MHTIDTVKIYVCKLKHGRRWEIPWCDNDVKLEVLQNHTGAGSYCFCSGIIRLHSLKKETCVHRLTAWVKERGAFTGKLLNQKLRLDIRIGCLNFTIDFKNRQSGFEWSSRHLMSQRISPLFLQTNFMMN